MRQGKIVGGKVMNNHQKIINKTVKNLREMEKIRWIKVDSFYRKRKKVRILAKKNAILSEKKRADYEVLKVGQKNSAYILRLIRK